MADASFSDRFGDASPLDPEDNSFETLWWRRAARPGQVALGRQSIEDSARAQDAALMSRWSSMGHFDPRPDIMAKIEDQRGMYLPELDLQAKYLAQHGAYAGNLLDPLSYRTPAWSSDMASELGGRDLDKAITFGDLASLKANPPPLPPPPKRTYVPVNRGKESKAK